MTGYRDPPKEHQFKKGVSGNPKGRPKGRVNLATELIAEISETVEIVENGRRKKVPKLRVLLKALMNRGIKQDTRAADIILTLNQKLIEPEPEMPVSTL
jgi:hypothetical protein